MEKSWLLFVVLIHIVTLFIGQPPPHRGGFQHAIRANILDCSVLYPNYSQ